MQNKTPLWIKLKHHLILPRVVMIEPGFIFWQLQRSCPKARAGYNCHGRPGECL